MAEPANSLSADEVRRVALLARPEISDDEVERPRVVRVSESGRGTNLAAVSLTRPIAVAA